MRVAEKLDWKGLKIKKSFGNRKTIMSDEVRHRIGKVNAPTPATLAVFGTVQRSKITTVHAITLPDDPVFLTLFCGHLYRVERT
jgi:hypothetical protein